MSNNENKYSSLTPRLSDYNDYKNEDYYENMFTSLVSLLMTPRGSHPYDPNYGVGIRSFILTNDNGNLAAQIESDITTAIMNYLPDLYTLVKVVVTRSLNESGIGYNYKINVVVTDMIVTFKMSKQGTLMYEGLTNE